MKRLLARILSVLLIGALLVSVGLAEDEPVAELTTEETVIIEESVEEPVEEAVEEPVEVVPEEPVEEVVEAVASEPVEAAVEEAEDVELAEEAEAEVSSVDLNAAANSGEISGLSLEPVTELVQSERMLNGNGGDYTGTYRLDVGSSSTGTGNGGSTGADIGFCAYYGDAPVHGSANDGDVISLRFNTSSGFTLTRIVLAYGDNNIELDISNPQFTMPAANATVTGYFTGSGSQSNTGDTGSGGGQSASNGTGNSIPVDEAHFPDAAFRQYISENIDRENGASDGALSDNEIAMAVSITLFSKNIVNLTGIKYFTNLSKLHAQCGLTALDVSGMPNLASVYCACNQITALNFSNCPNLTSMVCYTNKLASLVVDGCPKLEILECHNNSLKSLVFANNCPNLRILSCEKNKLSVLDLSNQPEFVARWKSWKYKKKYKNYTWTAIRRSNPPQSLTYDNKTKIKTGSGSAVPAAPAGFAEVPGAVAAQVTVAAGSTAKNTRATVVAAPGAKTRLDLGGATGKKFKSSNRKVATVTKGGVVTFKKGGKVKITYKVGKKTRKVTMTVTDPTMPTAVAFPAVNTAVKKGESVTLTPTVNEGANPGGYKWKSSNRKVATVKNGVVKFKKAGKVTITCTTKRGKKKARVTFVVSK